MPDSGASSIPGLVLSEARELRSKQDARLRALQALSRSMLAGFLSAALIALAARPADNPVDSAFGFWIAYTAAVLVGISLLVEFLVSRWKEGPDIHALFESFGETSDAGGFEMFLALMHDDDRIRNEALLVRAKRFIALQVCGTFGGGAMLLALDG